MSDRKEKNIMDGSGSSADNMRLTKYGLRMKLLKFSSDLSVTEIFVSIVVIIGGIALLLFSRNSIEGFSSTTLYGTGTIIISLEIPLMAMWILLKLKTRKQDIHGIENIGKVYSYVSGSLEIILLIAFIGLQVDVIVALVYVGGG